MHNSTPMRVFQIIAVVGLLSLLGFWALGPAFRADALPAGPVPQITPQQQTLQATAQTGEIEATYRIQNSGQSDLKLGPISTTCGCTAAEVVPEVVPPGGTAVVTVKGRPPASGSQKVSIRIASNAQPAHEIAMELTLIGSKPVPYVASASPAVSFGPIDLTDVQVLHVETRETLGSKPWLSIPRFSAGPLRV